MGIYTDPRTGRQLDLYDSVRPTAHSAWLSVFVLLLGVVLAGWYVFATGAYLGEKSKASAVQPPASSDPAP